MKATGFKAIAGVFILFLLSQCGSKKAKQLDLKNEMHETVSFLANDSLKGRATGSAQEQEVVHYIAEAFKSAGLKPKGTDGYLQAFKTSPQKNPHGASDANDSTGISVTNVVGLLDNPGDEVIIIGAHHDHLGMGEFGTLYRGDSAVHNGADDNASGVAVLLALAKTLSKESINDDILFITFSGEERGLWGSSHYAKNPTIAMSHVKAMINMDMVGRLNEKKELVAHGTGTSPVWPDLLNENNTDSLHLIMKPSGVGPSDHTSFYLQDVPVLHFFTGQHEDYHKPSDDTEKLNYEGMVTIEHYINGIVKSLSNLKEVAFTKTKDESNNTPRFKVTLGVVPDYLFDGKGMRIDGVTEGKTAAKAGIEKGDIVVAMGDSTVTDMMSYMRALSAFEKGDTTTVKIKRADEELSVKVEF